jgi:Na+:H+ antiporter, NhaA family
MLAFNRFGIHMLLPYFIVGLLMWFFMLESGVHATIAGVLAALAIPSTPKRVPSTLTKKAKVLLEEYEKYPVGENHQISEEQKRILTDIRNKINEVETPAARLEHNLHLPVALVIIPIFALANAGIKIDFSSIGTTIVEPVSLGIILGLIFGKVIGIFGVSYVAVKLKIAQLPRDSSMSQVFGVAFLGGIGFTMSIFVADLAFINNPELILQAKIGILSASLFSALFGYLWLRTFSKK